MTEDRLCARRDAMAEILMEVRILGKPAMFCPLHIDYNTIPPGYYMYDIRDDNGDAIEIAAFVLCDHWGTVITRDEIALLFDGYAYFLSIEPEDLIFCAGDCHYMRDFMLKYPPYGGQ